MIQVQLKLRPTKAQARTFERWLWHLTSVWNWAIKKIEADARNGHYRSVYSMKTLVRGHSQRMGVPSYAMGGTIATAHTTWERCFRGVSRRPRLKGRRRPLSSIAFDHWDSSPRGRRIHVHGIGPMRFHPHPQEIPAGHIGAARIVHRASGWYLCLFIKADPRPIEVIANGEVGIDPGFSSLLTLSTGEKIEHPHEWKRGERRLAQSQRGHRTKLAARLQERIRNRRKNRNHHISRMLVAENRLIAFSADQHRGIARTFGKSVMSAGHYELRRQLAYKSLTGGRRYVEVPPRNSTRTCSVCGALTGPTGWRGLQVRSWDCGACGAHHDRDVNAAVNTLRTGLGMSLKGGREAASGIAS